ncbi:trichohyalin-like protein 1 [Sorex fumeus]|uniref:trichohyalin-like protein 1 n=1 Tax=Sorex fumeus TaxID=62283 RepID=UPI0024ADA471|nr:trichohyalin-like protein 1 [Sorex fumeus]
MPQLLRDILYVIETFYNYAKEDGNKATLTCRELKQLIQGEFGDILQPSVIHAVERKLDLLDIDSDGNITFEEFLLAIFNLLNLCYLDIQSLLNSEARPMSKSGEKPDDVVLQTNNTTCQMTEGILITQDKEQLPSGTQSSAQLSPEERGEDECDRADQQGDIKTSRFPELSGISVPRNQHLVGEQSQEESQEAHTGENNEVQLETSKPTAGHIGSSTEQVGQDKEGPEEGDKPGREQSDQETRQQFGGKGGNLVIQSTPQEAATQKPFRDQEVDLEMNVKEHNKIQAVQKKDDLRAEQTIAQKPCLTQKLTESEDKRKKGETEEVKRTPCEIKNSADGTDTEIQKPPAQKTKELPVQGDGGSASETPDVRVKRKERRDSDVCGREEKRESERKTQPLAVVDQTQEKYQEHQESFKERDTQKYSMTQELSLEGREKSHPGIERAAVPGEEEKSRAETLRSDEDTLAKAAGSLGRREGKQELAPLEDKSGRKNKTIDQTSDKSVNEDDGYQGQDHEPTATKNDERASKTCSSPVPKARDRSSETINLSVQGKSQRPADAVGESVQENQEQITQEEENVAQEVVVHSDREEDEQLTEEQRLPVDGEDQDNQSSGTKDLRPAMEPGRDLECQKSIEEGENTKSLKMEVPGALEKDLTDQFSVTELPAKNSRKERQVLIASGTREEEGEIPNIQNILVKSMDENNSASPKTHLETQESTTWKEKKSPQAVKEEVQQQSLNTGHNSSVSQSDLKEMTQKDQSSFSMERGTVYSNPLYMYLQKNVLQQRDITQDQNEALPVKSSSPGLQNNPSGVSLAGDSQVSQEGTKELLFDEDKEDIQQTASTQAREVKQGLIERSQYHEEKQTTQSTK